MRAGRLRHYVAIQERTQAQDAAGQPTDTWANVSGLSSVNAAVEPAKAVEKQVAEQLGHNVTHVVRIRYMAGITSDMRIVHNGRYLDIVGIRNPDERNIELVIECEERGNG